MKNEKINGPGGCKPKLPPHLKRKKDTITLLRKDWAKLDEIGPSRGKAVEKLLRQNKVER